MLTQRPLQCRSFALSFFVVVLLASAPRSAAAQPAGYVFVAGNYDFHIIDTATQTAAAVGPSVGFEAVASRDGSRVYLTNNGAFRVIDVARKQVVATVNIPGNSVPEGFAVTPDETTAWIAHGGNNNVSVIDLSTNTVAATIPVPLSAFDVTITPDGTRAIVTGFAHMVAILDVQTRTLTKTIALTGNSWAAAVHPDGHRAYVTSRDGSILSVVDLDAGTELTTIPLTSSPTDVAVSADGSTVYVVGQAPTSLFFVSTATNTVTKTLAGAPTTFFFGYSVALSPDGSKIYVGALNDVDTVAVVDAATRTFVTDVTTAPYPFGLDAGPPIIRGDCCADTTIASDADLTALHMSTYVPFFHGTLKLTDDWVSSRTLSLLSDGAARTDGIIDTNGHLALLDGPVIGAGALVKRGQNTLRLSGHAVHAGGTRVEAGGLDVVGQHDGTVTLASPTASVQGSGTIGAIHAPSGFINAYAGVLHAGQVTLGSQAGVVALIKGAATTNRLAVTGTAALNNADLVLFFDAPESLLTGEAVTLVEHVTGQFRDKPEGWTIVSPGGRVLRLSYHGGSSGADAALIAEEPPTLGALSDRTIVQNTALGPLTLAVGDSLTPPAALTISATSSNAALVPNTNLQIGNSGGVRTLTVTPLFDASGQTTITVTVTDEAQLQAQRTFVLTVLPTRSYYLAEGATGGFFTTDILLANPNAEPAPIDITFSTDDGATVTRQMTLPATSRSTLRVNDLEELGAAAFSTTVVSTGGLPLMVERTMWWDGSGYGASTEKAGTEGATSWYFAEGAQGYFHTYFLLFNPNITATVAHVTYLMEDGTAILRDYPVPANTRVTVDASEQPELIDRSFGARIVFDQPALAERAMYFGTTPLYTGGAAAAGVTAPATTWYLAEGATGSFFDTYVLIANPNDAPATLTVTYLPDAGQPIVKTHTLAAQRRLTLDIASEDPALRSAAVSTRVDADQPVVVERSQYWPHGHWYESHASAGETTPGLRWGLAEGRVGGASDARTFILIANPGASPAAITATFLRADGTTVIKTFTVEPTSRFTIGVTGDAAGEVPELADESFATVITSTEPVIVERSLYTSANGLFWTAGTSATGTRLDP